MLELDDKISPDGVRALHRRSARGRLATRRSLRSPPSTGRPAATGRARSGWPCGRRSPRSPSPSASGSWWCCSGWRPEYVLPAPATVFDRLGELIADGTVLDALQVTGERAIVGLRRRARHRHRARVARRLVEDRPLGRRLADHRPADDAVDRLVPARHPAVPAVRTGDHLRRRARRGAVDRQRADHRRRPHPAAAAAGRAR